uniref:NADH dehydrogenase [ubiquinone] iron-sulfur protein 5 n=1 Tax=Cyanistes caeruleus TaxID=156563 RepID=A0A8C0ZH82_CYACU
MGKIPWQHQGKTSHSGTGGIKTLQWYQSGKSPMAVPEVMAPEGEDPVAVPGRGKVPSCRWHRLLRSHGPGSKSCPINPAPPACAQRLRIILEQRDRMIKQGKYTPPDYHTGKEEPRP